MAPRTSGSSLGRSFVQAEKKLDEEEKEMAYNENMEEEEEGKNTLPPSLPRDFVPSGSLSEPEGETCCCFDFMEESALILLLG